MDVATSVISLVTTTITVVNLLKNYASEVKDAKSDIDSLYSEVVALQKVLEQIAHLVDEPRASKFSTLALLQENNGPAEKCAAQLAKVQKRLNPEGMRKAGWRALSWPFKGKEVKETIKELERYKSAFVLALSADQATMTVSIDTGVTFLQKDFAAARLEDAEEREQDKLVSIRRDVLAWLSTTDPSINHSEQRRKHRPTTGDWFLQGQELAEWRQAPNSFIWLHGTSGSGKTVLSSTIIEFLKDSDHESKRATAYYYFDFNDPEKRKAVNFVTSVMEQLCSQLPFLPQGVGYLWSDCHEGRQRPVLKRLMKELCRLLEDFLEVYLVIDALDECAEEDGERADLLDIIAEMHSWQSKKLHMMVTSRRQTDIEVMLEPLLIMKPISMADEQINADVKILISRDVCTLAKKNRWPPTLTNEVEDALLLGSNGMCVFIFPYMRFIASKFKDRSLKSVLR